MDAQAVLNAIFPVHYVLDRSFRFTSVNDTALRGWRRSREEVVGCPFSTVFPDAAGAALRHAQDKAMGGNHIVNETVISPAADHLPTEVVLIPLSDGLEVYWRHLHLVSAQAGRTVGPPSGQTEAASDGVSALLQMQGRLRELATSITITEHRDRRRLANEVRDHLAQLVALAVMKLHQAGRHARVPAVKDTLREATVLLKECAGYVRTLSYELCPPVLQDFGLVPALRWLTEHMGRRGLHVDLRVGRHAIDLPEEPLILLFQSVRELLTNVRKHARINRVIVDVAHDHEALHITVKDHGVGFDADLILGERPSPGRRPGRSRFGLFNVRESMAVMGGGCRVFSTPEAGTCVTLTLPMRQVGLAEIGNDPF